MSIAEAFKLSSDQQASQDLKVLTETLELRVQERTQALVEAQTDLALAISASQIGIWKWDVRQNRITWSDQLHALFGVLPNEIQGNYSFEQYLSLIHPDDRDHVSQVISKAIESREPYEVEHRTIWPDGSVHWILGKGQAFFNPDGALARMIGTAINITERKQAESLLNEAIGARDDFLSIASHELKTPLTTLKMQTQMRLRSLEKSDFAPLSPEIMKKQAQTDLRQIDRLTRLIDDMLDISRIRTGKLTIQLEEFDFCELARNTVENYRPQFEAAGYHVELKCCDDMIGRWDRFRIEQVMANLFTNAIRYGACRPIQIRVSRCEGYAELTVRDQGIGIAREDQERIFQRFERARFTSETGGLGLGLYIVRQIVEMHGGTIRVESEPGKGSCFILRLPI